MLDLRDSQARTVLTWFHHCYDVDISPTGAAFWRRVLLPTEGGIGDQDAWLINGMEFVATLQQDMLDQRRRAQRPRD